MTNQAPTYGSQKDDRKTGEIGFGGSLTTKCVVDVSTSTSSPSCAVWIKDRSSKDDKCISTTHSFEDCCKGNPKRTSVDDAGEHDLCRICQIGESENCDNPLITPCRCNGSVRYVHQNCLQKWIKSSDIKCCELCRYEFKMQTKLKPFSKWEKLDMSTSERRKILCSIGFHLVAITCVIWSLYVLVQRTVQEIQQKEFHWPFWTKLIVVAIGFIGGLVFMYVQCKVYVQLWRRLKAYNRVIYVQNNPLDASSSSAAATTKTLTFGPSLRYNSLATSNTERGTSNPSTSECDHMEIFDSFVSANPAGRTSKPAANTSLEPQSSQLCSHAESTTRVVRREEASNETQPENSTRFRHEPYVYGVL